MLKLRFLPLCVLITLFLCAGCDNDEDEDSNPDLEPLEVFDLNVPAPNGLCMSADGNHLWTVSDSTDYLYKLDMQGQTQEIIMLYGMGLRGVCIDSRDSSFYSVSVTRKAVVHLDSTGTLLEEFQLPDTSVVDNLFGLALDESSDVLYVVQSAYPGNLYLMSIHGGWLSAFELDSGADCSGLCMDSATDRLWIVFAHSDRLKRMNSTGVEVGSWTHELADLQGIEEHNGYLYVISSTHQQLYVLDKP